MPSVNFVDNTTVIDSAWLNDVNTHVFTTHPIAIGGTGSNTIGTARQSLAVPYNHFSEIAIETYANLPAETWWARSGQSFFISAAYDDNEIFMPAATSMMAEDIIPPAARTQGEMHYFFYNKLSSQVTFKFPVNDFLNGDAFGYDVPSIILPIGYSLHLWVNADGWWYWIYSDFSTDVNHTWTKAQRGAYVTLTSDYGTISIDLDQSNNFKHELIENTELSTPSIVVPGQSGVIEFSQVSQYDTYIPSFSSFWQFTNGSSWSDPAIESGNYGLLSYVVSSDGYRAYCTWVENFAPAAGGYD